MFCKNCGKEISDKAVICPECQTKQVADKKQVNGCAGCLIALAVVLISVVGFFMTLGGSLFVAENQMEQIKGKVAQDAVEQYNIAKAQGDKIQICVQAGLVSAAFLQAKDQENYNHWKVVEKKACRASGMPF